MTMPEIFIFLQGINLLWLVGLTLMTWLRKPGMEAAKAAEKIENDMQAALRELSASTDKQLRYQLVQITQIQTHMSHMPSAHEVSDLQSSVKTIDERTRGMQDTLSGLAGAFNRINDFLRASR